MNRTVTASCKDFDNFFITWPESLSDYYVIVSL